MRPVKPKPGDDDTSIDLSKAQAGDCVLLKAVTVTKPGAFMQFREDEDLLVPISQQLTPMVQDQSYLVYLLLDPNQRLIGSSKLHKFLDERAKNMAPGDEADLMIVGKTDLGYKAVINGTHLGLLYKDEVFQSLQPGERIKGYIKTIREDRKIDLALHGSVGKAREELTDRILAYLKVNNGMSSLTDYSPPDDIYKQYGVSKGSYKKALGALYKKRLISVSKDRVSLLKQTDRPT